MRGDEGLPHRHRRHHDVGRPPPQLLGDLVGDGLFPLVLEGVAGGAAIEEDAVLHEPVPDTDQVVVDPPVDDEVGRGGGHVQELGRRGLLVGEDEGAEPGARRVGGDGGARVAGADHRGGREAELQRGRHRRRGRAVLHGAGGIGALELREQPSHAEAPAQRGAFEQRALALAQRHAMGGIGDRQHGRVAPEPAAGEDGGPGLRERVPVVLELEQLRAPSALKLIGEREGRPAVDAAKSGRQGSRHVRVRHVRLPKRCSVMASISSRRWRRVCSLSARVCAFSPMARASSGWAR